MPGRSDFPLLALSAAVLALAAAPGSALATEAAETQMRPAASVQLVQTAEKDGVPDGDVEDPNKLYPVTPNEVEECMKAWDPQTQMSKAEFEASCKSSLKYFPEDP